jgi:hypothetical protein
MAERFDPFIRNLHKMCRKDDIATQQLIAGTISWADVPSDDDIMELEGWRAYAEIQNRARNAYHRTVRIQKRPVQRATVKQLLPKPMERKPYHVLKQEQTKHIVENGRITPVKEIVDMVVQPPIEYKDDVEFMTTQKRIESQMEKLVEKPVEKPMEIQHIIPPIEIPSQVTKINSKEPLKRKYVPTPIIYEPTCTELYLLPLIPYIVLLFLLVIVHIVKL